MVDFRKQYQKSAPDTLDVAPLGGTRPQAMQRLQIGIAGVVGIILLIGLVSLVEDRARIAEDSAVPESVAATEPEEAPSQSDPLVEAGVVPDLPATPAPTTAPTGAVLPEKGVAEDEEAQETDE